MPDFIEILDVLQDLIYLDHEHDTDVAGYLGNTVREVNLIGLGEQQAHELLNDRIELLITEAVITDHDHILALHGIMTKLSNLVCS
jgi:hypothetical protein